MKEVKLLLGVTAVFSAIAAVMLLWNINTVECGETTAKLLGTIFIIVALITTRDCAKL